jgi:serine/threonine-protein kinase RsbW
VEPNDGDSIRLTVPATAAAVRITRVGAAGVATRAGFTYREVEEVRLAVGEAAALLALSDNDEDGEDEKGRGTLVVVYTVGPGGLSVDLHVEDESGRPTPISDLAAAVLDASVDEWEASAAGRRVVLHKHRTDVDDEG